MTLPPDKLGIVSLQYYSYPDEVGGAWKLTHEVNRRLVERGHRVSLITCKPSEEFPDYEVIDGVGFYRIGVAASKSPFALSREVGRKFREISRTHRVDLIHVHNPLVQAVGMFHSRFRAVPKVYHFHSLWHDEEKINRAASSQGSGWLTCGILTLIRWVEWMCFKSSRRVLFLSEYSRKRFEEFYPCAHPALTIIPGGVDTDAYRPGGSGLSQGECRERLNLPRDVPVLLTVRRLAARMGLENLVAACALIARRSPELKFFLAIVGKGDLREKLERQIREAGLQDRIRMAGKVTGEQIHLYYEAADMFVLPTLAIEGFGLATAEALATGLPALGTPVGGTVEILSAIDRRMLFDGTAPEQLAERIESFLKDPAPFHALKETCRREAVEKYGWEQVVDRIERSFYDTLSGIRAP